MTVGGMLSAERLKTSTDEQLDSYLTHGASQLRMNELRLVAVGVVVLAIGILMLYLGTTERLDFTLIFAGIVLITCFEHEEKDL